MRFLRLKQSNHVLLSFFMLVTAFFFIAGCVEDGNNQGAASPVAEGGFLVPIPLQLNKIPPGSTLTAFLVIDGGTPIPMTVNGDNVSANTGELSAGKHTFTITYFLNGERVAAATSEAIIIAGENTAIPFDISQVDQDLDKDGVIGIDEVISGTDPDNALSVPQAPDGVIDFPISNVTINSGESVNFSGTVTDPDINTFTFLWDFGGGADNASLEDPGAIVFKIAGTFTVTFTATDSLGLKDPLPDTRVITVKNQSPNGVIDTPLSDVTIKAGQSVNFSATVIDPDNLTPPKVLWDFDGVVDNASLEDPGAVVFASPGIFTVSFTVTDVLGLVDLSPDKRVITVQETNAPTVKISFPPPVSLTDAKQITVRGTATDETGVSSVLVNGKAASTIDGFAHWQAVVPLNRGENILLVETSDTLGNSKINAASVMTERQLTFVSPRGVALDAANNRALIVDTSLGALIAVDLATEDRTILSDASPLVGNGPAFSDPQGVTLDAANNRALVIDRTLEALIAVDLATGNRTILSDDSPLVGNGPAFRDPIGVTLDAANNRALVIDHTLDGLIAVDLATGNRTILSGGFSRIGNGPDFLFPVDVTLDATNNRVLIVDLPLRALIAVDLATGNRTILSDGFFPFVGSGQVLFSPSGVTLDAANNRALVIDRTLNALFAVDLATGNRTILSDVSPLVGNGPDFGDPIGVTLDTANNRALIVSFSLRVLFAVDLATGNRTVLSDAPPLVGSGPAFGDPRDVTLDSENNRALVTDFSLDALFAVDLATGNRTILSDASPLVGNGPAFVDPRGVTLDSENNRALVTDLSLDTLIGVDLATGNRTILSDASPLVGNGPAFFSPNGVTLDVVNNRALIVNLSLDTLIGVDLATGNRTILSDASPLVGSGPAFLFPVDVTLDATNNRALIVSLSLKALFAVDLATGNRTILSDASLFAGSGPAFVHPNGVSLDVGSNRVLVTDRALEALFSVDLMTGNRTILSDASPVAGNGPAFVDPNGVTLDAANNRALVVDSFLKVVFMVDLENGERVIISR